MTGSNPNGTVGDQDWYAAHDPHGKPHVYLAGGINGLSDAEAIDWRQEATDRLDDLFDVLDPMARDYRGVELDNVAAIVEGDLADIARCSVILARVERPSWGTAMEIAIAAREGRHVVAFGAGERPSPWLAHHTELVPDLEAGIARCRKIAGELEHGVELDPRTWQPAR